MHIISASFVEDADIDSHTVTSQHIVHSISRPTKRLCKTEQLVSDVTWQVFFKAGYCDNRVIAVLRDRLFGVFVCIVCL